MISVLAAAAVMAAVLALSALPAFAQLPGGGPITHPVNHGALVSTAAHDCGQETQKLLKVTNHGQCVSFVAHGGKLPTP